MFIKGVLFLKRTFFQLFAAFWVGAIAYGSVEVIERGYSHISMACLGGISMVAIHLLNDDRRSGAHTLPLLVLSSLFITSLEFLAGEILNVYLKMHIWSYSGMAYNIDGVICLSYTGCWLLLSFAGMVIDDLMRWQMFRERADFYYIIRRKARRPSAEGAVSS